MAHSTHRRTGEWVALTCHSCGASVSCFIHEAELSAAIERIVALELELVIVQVERAEKTRMWDCARKEVERLSKKLEGRQCQPLP